MSQFPGNSQATLPPRVPTTPLRSAPLPDEDSKLMAPVKKYPSRMRRLTDQGVEYWKHQMNTTDLGDPFLSSLVSSDGKRIDGGTNTPEREPAGTSLTGTTLSLLGAAGEHPALVENPLARTSC